MLYEQEISLVRLSDGNSGRSSFVHIKYSNDGKTFTTNNGEDIGSWLGIYTDDKEEESTVFSDYKWSKILGATGAVGTGIDSVTKEFYLSNSKVAQSGGSWQTKMPEWSYGKYLWTREKIVYKNPTSTVYTTPSCDSSWEAANVVDKKVTTLQTDFKVEQGKIESLIKETSVIKETYTTKDEFNNLQIGGRNLLLHSSMIGEQLKCDNTIDMDSITSKEYETDGLHLITPSSGNQNNGAGFIYNDFTKLGINAGDTIAFSLLVKGSSDDNSPFINIIFQNDGETWYGENILMSSESHFTPTDAFQKVYVTYTLPKNENYTSKTMFLGVHGNYKSDLYIKNLKLELGNKATDWTPAPEDLEQKVTTLTDKYNQTVQTVEGNKTTIANVKTSVDEVSGKVTKMESSITEIKQTADGITTTVTANKDKWDKASSDASNALNNSTQAKKDAENALNKAQDVVNKVENGELDGQDAIMLYIDSNNGTTFKNSSVATIFTVTIYVGGTIIDNSTKLKQMYGDGAYLQWLIKKHGEKDFTKIPLDDPRLNDNGFIFTIAAKDIKFKAVFNCELNI